MASPSLAGGDGCDGCPPLTPLFECEIVSLERIADDSHFASDVLAQRFVSQFQKGTLLVLKGDGSKIYTADVTSPSPAEQKSVLGLYSGGQVTVPPVDFEITLQGTLRSSATVSDPRPLIKSGLFAVQNSSDFTAKQFKVSLRGYYSPEEPWRETNVDISEGQLTCKQGSIRAL